MFGIMPVGWTGFRPPTDPKNRAHTKRSLDPIEEIIGSFHFLDVGSSSGFGSV